MRKADIKTAGVIGLGVGRHHVAAYRKLGIETYACDFGDQKWPMNVTAVSDWKELVECSDIVSVCSWDRYHEEQVIYALERDRHVICEKPLSHTRSSLEKIAVAARNSNGTLSMNFPLRYCKADGKVWIYNWGRNSKLHDGWRRNTSGYNVCMGGLIHFVDLLYEKRRMPGNFNIIDVKNKSSPKQYLYDYVVLDVDGTVLVGDFSGDDGDHYIILDEKRAEYKRTAGIEDCVLRLRDARHEGLDRLLDIHHVCLIFNEAILRFIDETH